MWRELLSKIGILTQRDKEKLLLDMQEVFKEIEVDIQKKQDEQNKEITKLEEIISNGFAQMSNRFSSTENRLDKSDVAIDSVNKQIEQGVLCLQNRTIDDFEQTKNMFSLMKGILERNIIETKTVCNQVEKGISILSNEMKDVHKVMDAIKKYQKEMNDSIVMLMESITAQTKVVDEVNRRLISEGGQADNQFISIKEKQKELAEYILNIQTQLKQIALHKDMENMEELLKILILNSFIDDVDDRVKRKKVDSGNLLSKMS